MMGSQAWRKKSKKGLDEWKEEKEKKDRANKTKTEREQDTFILKHSQLKKQFQSSLIASLSLPFILFMQCFHPTITTPCLWSTTVYF